MKTSIIWLRRNLRLDDNKVIAKALEVSEQIFFTFVFDSNILSHFPSKEDRRLSFIVAALELIDIELKKHGSGLIILYGDPENKIPELSAKLGVTHVFADEDFEPSSIKRDANIASILAKSGVKLQLVLDHLLIHPSKVAKADGSAYKVFTPYMRAYRSYISISDYCEYKYSFDGKLGKLGQEAFSKEKILEKAGYIYKEDDIWIPRNVLQVYDIFVKNKLHNYHNTRNNLAIRGSSKLSPYLRFGLISIRKCFKEALSIELNETWVNELIWREFYAYIMYHFPSSIENEFQEKYIGRIEWNNDPKIFEAFCAGKTGFPVVDAAVRQLVTTGWMHNRARMIVASFFTKNLFIDWRLGEKFFGQYLMDYDLASNVGGWQWSASTGTDAQPYFRVFNPMNQARDHDQEGEYIKTYVPELKSVPVPDIFDGSIIFSKYRIKDYPKPIVDYKESREYAISYFKNIDVIPAKAGI